MSRLIYENIKKRCLEFNFRNFFVNEIGSKLNFIIRFFKWICEWKGNANVAMNLGKINKKYIHEYYFSQLIFLFHKYFHSSIFVSLSLRQCKPLLKKTTKIIILKPKHQTKQHFLILNEEKKSKSTKNLFKNSQCNKQKKSLKQSFARRITRTRLCNWNRE